MKTYQSIIFCMLLILLPAYAININATAPSLVRFLITTMVCTQLTNRNHREQAMIAIHSQEHIESRQQLIGLAREHEAHTQRAQQALLTSLDRLGSLQSRLLLLRRFTI